MKTESTIHFRYYDIIIALFALCLLISNLAATKLVSAGPLILDGGALLFPLTYILGDVLTEVYGYRYARQAIWMGFIGMLLAVGCFTIVGFFVVGVNRFGVLQCINNAVRQWQQHDFDTSLK
jgi:uncharacterized PurR-regulated membrane protein YhhQ (DUF165 family)